MRKLVPCGDKVLGFRQEIEEHGLVHGVIEVHGLALKQIVQCILCHLLPLHRDFDRQYPRHLLLEYLRPERKLEELVERFDEDLSFLVRQVAEVGNDKLDHVGNDGVEPGVEQFSHAGRWTGALAEPVDVLCDP